MTRRILYPPPVSTLRIYIKKKNLITLIRVHHEFSELTEHCFNCRNCPWCGTGRRVCQAAAGGVEAAALWLRRHGERRARFPGGSGVSHGTRPNSGPVCYSIRECQGPVHLITQGRGWGCGDTIFSHPPKTPKPCPIGPGLPCWYVLGGL